MNPKQHILDTLEALIISLDTDTSTTGTDILNKTIDFSKSLHAIVPDPVDLEQEETYLLHDNNLLRQSGIPTLALIHHFFEHKTPLTLELSHAQLQEAWVRYAIKIRNGLAHKASLFKDDGNNIDMLGGVSLPNIS